jgi:hypothetical protein
LVGAGAVSYFAVLLLLGVRPKQLLLGPRVAKVDDAKSSDAKSSDTGTTEG